MLQTLFHIPRELFSLPLFGFGLLLAVWAVSCAVFLGFMIARRGFDAETRGYLPVLLVLGFAIAFVIPAILDEQGLPIQGYGTMLVVAIVSASGLAVRRAARVGIHPELVLSLAFWAFLGGIVGARAFYVIQKRHEFAGNSLSEVLFEIVNLAQGGLVVYGAMIGGTIASLIFMRKHQLPILVMGDLLAPAIALGMGLGRLGCFMNGCCFGGPCDLPWAVHFPQPSPPFQRQVERGEIFLHGLKFDGRGSGSPLIYEVEPNSLADQAGVRAGDQIAQVNGFKVVDESHAIAVLMKIKAGEPVHLQLVGKPAVVWTLPNVVEVSGPVHPTQIYSALDGVLLSLFLLAIYPYRRRDGEVLAWLLTLHPISRFLLEVVRTDEGGVLGTSLSISQVISIGILVGAAVLWWYLRGRPAGSVLPEPALAA